MKKMIDAQMPYYSPFLDEILTGADELIRHEDERTMSRFNLELCQNKAVNMYRRQGYLTDRDVFKIVGAPEEDAESDFIFGEKASIGTIKDHVKDVAEHYYVIKESGKTIVIPIPKKLWQTDNGYTTVEWQDGTKTSVCAEDGSKATTYGGFCACLAKKIFGSTSKAINAMQNADELAKWPAKKKEIERNRLKALKIKKAEMLRENRLEEREAMIRHEMDLIYAKREANRRIAEEGEHHER